MGGSSSMFSFTFTRLIALSILLRIGFFVFGLYQDAYMTVKYTDIDYLVFSDGANFVYNGGSPFERQTYRYTPLLAWLLVPNSYGGWWYSFGKMVFMVCDLITGYLIYSTLSTISVKGTPLSQNKVAVLSAIWLLNPMVITISTRGSSESLLTVMIMLYVYTLLNKRYTLSAIWLGISIHFKIYPIIYLPTSLVYLANANRPVVNLPVLKLVNTTNIKFMVVCGATVAATTGLMYHIYGYEFLYHAYLYHLERLDHRHNFSVYNVVLYYKSAFELGHFSIETYAFVPQLLISAVLLPLLFVRSNMVSCLFLQTFAFVTFNKVMTSQYFIWYLIFLPNFLATSTLIGKNKIRGLVDVGLWVVGQAVWLHAAYQLEFLGQSTFDGQLLYSAILFYWANCWILSDLIADLNTTTT